MPPVEEPRPSWRILVFFFTLCAVLSGAACNSHGHGTSVTTDLYYNAQVGSTPVKTWDYTAYAEINPNNYPQSQGCFATGPYLAQPPASVPPQTGGVFPVPYSIGSSPSVGQCTFSAEWGYSRDSYLFDLFSGQCWTTVREGIIQTPWVNFASTNVFDPGPLCIIPDYAAPAAGNNFALSNSLPATITVSAPNLTTTYGMPQLLAIDRFLNLKTTVNATSVAADGSNATFPFPAGLSNGMYMFAVKNLNGTNLFNIVDETHFSIGGENTLSSAFGVDAAETTTKTLTCVLVNYKLYCSWSLPTDTPTPIFTQYYSSQVSYAGHVIPVGTQPVAVKLYGTYTTSQKSGNTTTYTYSPANAIVVNSGSNSVSILNLYTFSVAANIAVGSQPLSVTLNSAGTYAYVPNYGSGTLSEINLSTLAVSRTVPIASGVQSVAMDPSGNYVWVGGNNYLYQVSLSSFAVVGSYAVNGSVTSLAASNAQNKLAYTLVQNCCSSSSTYAANEVAISSLSNTTAFSRTSASPYAQYTMNGTLPSAAVVPQATTVSSQFGNGLAASSTPTGFVVYDIVSNQPLMSGNTPTPVRGIASDPDNRVVYFTLPDSNEYLAVPLPYAQ